MKPNISIDFSVLLIMMHIFDNNFFDCNGLILQFNLKMRFFASLDFSILYTLPIELI